MYISRKTIAIILAIFGLIFLDWLGGKIYNAVLVIRGERELIAQIEAFGAPQWGSFTDDEITSSDGKYTASYSSMYFGEYNAHMVIVTVRDAETKQIVSSFIPARSSDFWGICWEEGTHNIWIQSADIGICCYAENEGKWTLDENAVRPESIVSKWDH